MNNPAYKNPSLTVAERIEDLLSRMTLEEKAGQLHQWFNLGPDQYEQVRRGEIGSGLMANSSTAGNNRQEPKAGAITTPPDEQVIFMLAYKWVENTSNAN